MYTFLIKKFENESEIRFKVLGLKAKEYYDNE